MKPKVIGTDNALEFGKACEDLSWNHCTSTPHRSETHGIAERAVRRLKEGTSAMPLQSGVDNEWWVDSMEFYSYLRHIQDLLFDGKTPYERRFGMPFNGPVIPFGALVENHLISANDQSRLHQLEQKSCQFFPADIEELEKMDASGLHARRINAKEVLTPHRSGNFMFPVSRWKSQNLWARTASENIHFDPLSSGTRRTRNSSRKVR